jgi:predicted lactoylglutathione lyase
VYRRRRGFRDGRYQLYAGQLSRSGGIAELNFINIFARDVVALSNFYTALFGFAELDGTRSPIFRALNVGKINMGFNAYDAHALLNLNQPVTDTAIATFMSFAVDSEAEVDRLTDAAVEMGCTLMKAPSTTYYGWYQSVLLDPEHNAFRIDFAAA